MNQVAKAFIDWIWSELQKRMKPQPGPPILIQIGKRRITVLNYKLTLPAATAPDVASWESGTVVNGTDEVVATIADGATISFNDGDQVVYRVREVDDAGNKSDWSPSVSFTASDTLAPPVPGAPSLVLESET